jgi:hypothetical protein
MMQDIHFERIALNNALVNVFSSITNKMQRYTMYLSL